MTQALVLTLSDQALAALKAAAEAAGRSMEEYAADLLSASLAEPVVREETVPFDDDRNEPLVQTPSARAFQHAAAVEALEHYDRTGEFITLEEFLSEFRADIEARLASR